MRYPKLLALCSLALLLYVAPCARGERPPSNRRAGVRLRVDPQRSRFIVRAFVGGLLSTFGHDHTIAVKDFAGDVDLDEDLRNSSLRMVVRAASLAVIDKVSERDRREIERTMRDEVLETSKYPEIVFRSTRVQPLADQHRVRIVGELTLHGVTRPVVIEAALVREGQSLRARGEFTLRQSDFKIKPPSIGLGTIRVKDEVKLQFDLIAVP